jgi:GTP cyclohydrolase I
MTVVDVDKVRDAVADLLLALGVDEGDHTADTPRRVAAAWAEALAGYDVDPRRHLERTFSAPADPGLVVVADLDVRSTCAHHLLPITGRATIAYRPGPGQPVVGLSKLPRVLGDYARRLQVQERLGWETATALQEVLSPVGAACVITATHGCISQRGIAQHQAVTTTTTLTGAWEAGHADVDMVLAEHRRVLR